jgi:hypothetical protein
VETLKSLEKRPSVGKRLAGVTASNTRLIEEALLPMMTAVDTQSGEIVAQVTNFSEYFANKQAITPESKCAWLETHSKIDAEKLLRMKGLVEVPAGKGFENKKEEEEFVHSVGSSFLQDGLNHEEVDRYNTYIKEKERIVELYLDATTINYKDCLVDSYRGVEDPFGTEIQDLQYAQNPIDPSQVIREPIFKKDAQSDG